MKTTAHLAPFCLLCSPTNICLGKLLGANWNAIEKGLFGEQRFVCWC